MHFCNPWRHEMQNAICDLMKCKNEICDLLKCIVPSQAMTVWNCYIPKLSLQLHPYVAVNIIYCSDTKKQLSHTLELYLKRHTVVASHYWYSSYIQHLPHHWILIRYHIVEFWSVQMLRSCGQETLASQEDFSQAFMIQRYLKGFERQRRNRVRTIRKQKVLRKKYSNKDKEVAAILLKIAGTGKRSRP